MNAIKLTIADDGKQVIAEPGQHVIISLPENPTTGFSWSSAPDVIILKNDYAPHSEGTGGGGVRVFTIAATEAGQVVHFQLSRLWSKGNVEQEFTCEIRTLAPL
jgi:predicted secreted protein